MRAAHFLAVPPEISTAPLEPEGPRATEPAQAPRPERDKALKILARSLYKDLLNQGFDQRHVVALATELLGEVTRHGLESPDDGD